MVEDPIRAGAAFPVPDHDIARGFALGGDIAVVQTLDHGSWLLAAPRRVR